MIKAGKKLHQKSRSKPQIGASKTILGYDRPPNEQATLKQIMKNVKAIEQMVKRIIK